MSTHDQHYIKELQNVIQNRKGGQLIDAPLLAMGTMNFFVNSATSIIVPFFPNQATACGVSTAWIGLIFAVLPLGSVAAGLPIGKYMLLLGRKRVMFVGLVVNCISILALAFIANIKNNPGIFIAIAIVSRLLQGASRSAYSTVVFSYVPILWPDAVQRHVGILESLTGLGVMLGPIIGGFFSELGNDAFHTALGQYQMPFFILGALFALWIIPTILLLPPDVKSDKLGETLPLGQIIKQKNIAMTCFASCISCAGSGFINPLYDNYMTVYGISQSNISYIYGFLALAYVLTLGILPIFEKKLIYKFTLSLGLLVGVVADLLFAPLPGMPWKWWTIIIGLVISGISQGMTILPQIPELKMLILKNQFTDNDVKAGDMASGIFFSAYSSGIFLGPLLSGIFQPFLMNDYLTTYPTDNCFPTNQPPPAPLTQWECPVSAQCPPTSQFADYKSGSCCYSFQLAFAGVAHYFAILQALAFLAYCIWGDAFKKGIVPMFKVMFGKDSSIQNQPLLDHTNFIEYEKEKNMERSVLATSIINEKSKSQQSYIQPTNPSYLNNQGFVDEKNDRNNRSRSDPNFKEKNTSLQPLLQ